MGRTTRNRTCSTKEESKSHNKKSREIRKGSQRTKAAKKITTKTTTKGENKYEYRVKNVKKKKGWGKLLQVEAIVSHRTHNNKRKYRVKLKDDPMTIWLSAQMLTAVSPDILHKYIDDVENNKIVEAIISHEKQKNLSFKYLLKWADESKRETWETQEKALTFCPNLFKAYFEKMQEEEAEAFARDNAVAAVLEHKLVHGASKYLIKWKNEMRDDSWLSAKKTISLCPQILDTFTVKHPDCVPRIKERPYHGPQLPKCNKKQYDIIEDFDEDAEWEVEKIMDVCFKKNKTREFLIRWKGYRSAYDSWCPEADLSCPDLIEKFMERKAKRDGAIRKPSVKAHKSKRKMGKPTVRLVFGVTSKNKSRSKRLSQRQGSKSGGEKLKKKKK